MGKLQAHEERINEIKEDVSEQTLFSKQDGSGYSQGGRGDGKKEVDLEEEVVVASIVSQSSI